jgi:natural product precursor
MKKVILKGKLNLKKETLAKLNQDNMKSIAGGATAGCNIATANAVDTINIFVGHTAQTACCPSYFCPSNACTVNGCQDG